MTKELCRAQERSLPSKTKRERGKNNEAIREPASVIPRLDTVVILPRLPELLFGQPIRGVDPQRVRASYEKSLPLHLISLSTVQLYCQSLVFSPLTLTQYCFEVASPPKFVTHHLKRHPDAPHALTRATLVTGFPLVLGATNRYMFHHAVREGVWNYMPRAIKVMRRSGITNIPTTDSQIGDANHDTLFNSTMIEIYNIFGDNSSATWTIDQTPNADTSDHDPQSQHAQDLARLQQTLVEELEGFGPKGHEWKDRVVVKTAEEAPPCTACGFDLAEYVASQGSQSS